MDKYLTLKMQYNWHNQSPNKLTFKNLARIPKIAHDQPGKRKSEKQLSWMILPKIRDQSGPEEEPMPNWEELTTIGARSTQSWRTTCGGAASWHCASLGTLSRAPTKPRVRPEQFRARNCCTLRFGSCTIPKSWRFWPEREDRLCSAVKQSRALY